VVEAAKPVVEVAQPPAKTVSVVVEATPAVATEVPPATPIVEDSRAAEAEEVTSAPPVAREGCLVLKSSPAGLLVSLDGKDMGWVGGRDGTERRVGPGWYEVGMGGYPGEVDGSVKVRLRGGSGSG
jgi:hypothetical protein